ncbi:hypothetical protein O181_103906 [Austropuccinia psidii MF-1]|uniref:Integrase catalytic domain-containing protein n=1 Tax=Austropuccinia psidii MF-1 TaxID=1389203 RepID=A0A9Q3JLK6_9BASI|nr:hypothetical protein [Austropuccinia psidii MF-1]
MANNTETKHKQPLPILTENNFPEWRRQTIGLLRQKKLYVHCIEETIPSLSSETRPSAADNKIIDSNIETCNIITNSLDLCTFANIVARIWSRFSKITYNGNLQSFISELRQSLNKIKTVGIKVGIQRLAFAILTKLPNDFNSLIEKVTLNTETQGSPDAILNLLHDAALKEEALKSSIKSNIDGKMALNRETFKSKTIHYCSNGRHNPLANHSPEKYWQLHPEKRPDRYQRDAKTNYTFARALLTVDKTLTEGDVLNVVLDKGASDHMFNDRSFFLSLNKIRHSTISTGCDSSSLTAIRKGTAKLIDLNGVCWTLKNSLYVPKLNTNLGALSQLSSQVTIKSTGENMNVFLNNATAPSFQCPSKSKVLETKVKLGIKCLSTRNCLWHQRLGHLNEKTTKTLIPTYKAAGEATLPPSFQTKRGNFSCLQRVQDLGRKLPLKKDSEDCVRRGSPPYTPEHNRIAGRGNRLVLEKARCLMQQTKLTDQFWAEATSTTTFLLNIAPKRDGISPYKKWFNRKQPVSNLRTFGCKAWVRIPPIKQRLKFKSIVWEGIMLGYENQASAYRILRLQDNSLRPHSEFSDIADESDSCSERKDEFHDAVEEMPQRRIRIIGPRHPTLITGDVSEANILPYRRRTHQTVETSTVPNNYQQAIDSKNGNR